MKRIWNACLIFLTLSFITGILYPVCITAIAHTFFRKQATGSLLWNNGKVVGSRLLGQMFTSNKYFWSRPSAVGYNPLPSGASNLSPVSLALKDSVIHRRKIFTDANTIDSKTVAPDMIFSSGSGLDPHISPWAAKQQVERVCSARNLDSAGRTKVYILVNRLIEGPQWGIFGEYRINVLALNRGLDSIGTVHE
jgi:potassium-transporting ATPase KdpC subunit